MPRLATRRPLSTSNTLKKKTTLSVSNIFCAGQPLTMLLLPLRSPTTYHWQDPLRTSHLPLTRPSIHYHKIPCTSTLTDPYTPLITNHGQHSTNTTPTSYLVHHLGWPITFIELHTNEWQNTLEEYTCRTDRNSEPHNHIHRHTQHAHSTNYIGPPTFNKKKGSADWAQPYK